jgi:hypothetical protein
MEGFAMRTSKNVAVHQAGKETSVEIVVSQVFMDKIAVRCANASTVPLVITLTVINC